IAGSYAGFWITIALLGFLYHKNKESYAELTSTEDEGDKKPQIVILQAAQAAKNAFMSDKAITARSALGGLTFGVGTYCIAKLALNQSTEISLGIGECVATLAFAAILAAAAWRRASKFNDESTVSDTVIKYPDSTASVPGTPLEHSPS